MPYLAVVLLCAMSASWSHAWAADSVGTDPRKLSMGWLFQSPHLVEITGPVNDSGLPVPWKLNSWNQGTTVRLTTGVLLPGGERGCVLEHVAGDPGAQLFVFPELDLPPRKRIEAKITYQLSNGSTGRVGFAEPPMGGQFAELTPMPTLSEQSIRLTLTRAEQRSLQVALLSPGSLTITALQVTVAR